MQDVCVFVSILLRRCGDTDIDMITDSIEQAISLNNKNEHHADFSPKLNEDKSFKSAKINFCAAYDIVVSRVNE